MYPKRLTAVDLPPKRSSAPAPGPEAIPPESLTGVKALLDDARRQLHAILQDEILMPECPLEVQAGVESAVRSIGAALGRLGL